MAQEIIVWHTLFDEAKKVLNERTVSPFIEAGGVSASILTKDGSIYTGVCIDTACTLGMCAERNAIANMITHGESHITKLVCISGQGILLLPCGACREFLMQLHKDSSDIEILTDRDNLKIVRLKDLIPAWWGREQFGP